MFSAKEIDKFLSENYITPKWIFINPLIWNGYWHIKERSKFLRWLGRKLRNKYIYSWGLQIYWQDGLKTWINID